MIYRFRRNHYSSLSNQIAENCSTSSTRFSVVILEAVRRILSVGSYTFEPVSCPVPLGYRVTKLPKPPPILVEGEYLRGRRALSSSKAELVRSSCRHVVDGEASLQSLECHERLALEDLVQAEVARYVQPVVTEGDMAPLISPYGPSGQPIASGNGGVRRRFHRSHR